MNGVGVRIQSGIRGLQRRNAALTRLSTKTTTTTSTTTRFYTQSLGLQKDAVVVTQTITHLDNPSTPEPTSSLPVTKASARSMVPRKAALQLTSEAQRFLRSLVSHAIESNDRIVGIGLKYELSRGTMKMVFKFDFLTLNQIGPQDEG